MEWPLKEPGVMRLRPDSATRLEVGRIFERLLDAGASSHPRKFDLVMNRIKEILMICGAALDSKTKGMDERVEAAIRRMEGSLSDKITVESLAKEASLSPSRFAHLFKELCGETPMERLERRRIERAKELLFISPAKLSEIASDCGFNSQFYFSRVFKRSVGVSPSEFRESIYRRG